MRTPFTGIVDKIDKLCTNCKQMNYVVSKQQFAQRDLVPSNFVRNRVRVKVRSHSDCNPEPF